MGVEKKRKRDLLKKFAYFGGITQAMALIRSNYIPQMIFIYCDQENEKNKELDEICNHLQIDYFHIDSNSITQNLHSMINQKQVEYLICSGQFITQKIPAIFLTQIPIIYSNSKSIVKVIKNRNTSNQKKFVFYHVYTTPVYQFKNGQVKMIDITKETKAIVPNEQFIKERYTMLNEVELFKLVIDYISFGIPIPLIKERKSFSVENIFKIYTTCEKIESESVQVNVNCVY